MKGFLRRVFRILPFFLLIGVLAGVIFYPRPPQAEGESVRIVTVWNVDTFEGGKGSRTSFLKRAAETAERTRDGVKYLITSVTQAGAEEALGRGELPDVLSFGGGLSAFEPFCLSLGERFAGSSKALPWCRGSYYLFSRTEQPATDGSAALSVGGNNLTAVAAYFAGVRGREVDSLSAYVEFLNGKWDCLLGTQRDKCRFAARGESVFSVQLTDFCDLYQYAAVLSEENYDDALHFVRTLRSDAVQCRLDDIGMLPVAGATGQTTGAFMEQAEMEKLRSAAADGDAKNNIENFLKTV